MFLVYVEMNHHSEPSIIRGTCREIDTGAVEDRGLAREGHEDNRFVCSTGVRRLQLLFVRARSQVDGAVLGGHRGSLCQRPPGERLCSGVGIAAVGRDEIVCPPSNLRSAGCKREDTQDECGKGRIYRKNVVFVNISFSSNIFTFLVQIYIQNIL